MANVAIASPSHSSDQANGQVDAAASAPIAYPSNANGKVDQPHPFHPATLASKLAAHEAGMNSPALSSASAQATAGSLTPNVGSEAGDAFMDRRSSMDSMPAATPLAQVPAAVGASEQHLGAEQANSNASSAFSSRAPTLGTDGGEASPSLNRSTATMTEGVAAMNVNGEATRSESTSPSKQHASAASVSTIRPTQPAPPSPSPAGAAAAPAQANVSPNKMQAPPAARSQSEAARSPSRPPMQEKRSMLGKLFHGNNDKEKERERERERERSKDRSALVSGSEPESGAESEASGASLNRKKSSGFKIGRRNSAGKEKASKDKDGFQQVGEAEKQAAIARARADSAASNPRAPSVERRGSTTSNAEAPLERKPSNNMGQSLKDFMAHAPKMHRKSSVTSLV